MLQDASGVLPVVVTVAAQQPPPPAAAGDQSPGAYREKSAPHGVPENSSIDDMRGRIQLVLQHQKGQK